MIREPSRRGMESTMAKAPLSRPSPRAARGMACEYFLRAQVGRRRSGPHAIQPRTATLKGWESHRVAQPLYPDQGHDTSLSDSKLVRAGRFMGASCAQIDVLARNRCFGRSRLKASRLPQIGLLRPAFMASLNDGRVMAPDRFNKCESVNLPIAFQVIQPQDCDVPDNLGCDVSRLSSTRILGPRG